MENFVRQLTSQFKNIDSVYDIPNFRVLDKLQEKLHGKIPLAVLGRALGRAQINVSSFEGVELLEKEGFLDEMARLVVMLYDYSMTTFGAPDFFIEAAHSLQIELKD